LSSSFCVALFRILLPLFLSHVLSYRAFPIFYSPFRYASCVTFRTLLVVTKKFLLPFYRSTPTVVDYPPPPPVGLPLLVSSVIKLQVREFLDSLSGYQLLEKGSDPCSYSFNGLKPNGNYA
jgi:hypothetical protein